MQIVLGKDVDRFACEIGDITGINVYDCYQCGKCTAGCPVAQYSEEPPSRILRLIQLNQKEQVLKSQTPYLCATCSTCSERCPMQIDVARIMETIRIYAAKNNIKPAVKEVVTFSDTFLDSVHSGGRLFEVGFSAMFNIRNMTPFLNIQFVPDMLKNGKLSVIPARVKNKERIKEIFNKSDYFEHRESSVKKGH